MTELQFPPLMSGRAVDGDEDPFRAACRFAVLGCDAGLIVHNLGADILRVAIVFAPEIELSKATVMLPICSVGFQNALGALAPPEVAVHLEWRGGLRINGARCGRLRQTASTFDSREVPDWLVVGLELPLWPASVDPGLAPDETALYAEGCADVEAPRLVESWARHTLNWLARWEAEGTRPLHAEWRGLAHGIGEAAALEGLSGVFLGVDEDFGMLLRDVSGETHLVPLSSQMEKV